MGIRRNYPSVIQYKDESITWRLFFNKKRRRDRKNYIGGLKWLEDCLVDMNILTDDSIESFENEFYEIILDRKSKNRIEIIIEENKK